MIVSYKQRTGKTRTLHISTTGRAKSGVAKNMIITFDQKF